MACKIETRRAIEESISRYISNIDNVYSKSAAETIAKKINDLWEVKIATPMQYSSLGGYKISISNLDALVEKEYNKDVEAYKVFERNINFYGGDEALMNQEEGYTNEENYLDEEEGFLQDSKSTASKASQETINLVKRFLSSAGIEYDKVKDIRIKGNKIDANGIANVTRNLIQVVEGKESEALLEESLHFLVELIQLYNPTLFQKLLKEVNSYKLKDEVINKYGSNPFYQKDGKPDILKLKKEAIAQVLNEIIIKKNEGKISNPEKLARVRTLWQAILDFFKKYIIKSGFDKTAIDFLSGKDFGDAKALIKHTNNLFLSNTRRDDIYNSLLENSKKIILKKKNKNGKWVPITKEDPVEQDDEQAYFVGEQQIKRRVSDLSKDYYKRQFRDHKLTESEFSKASNTIKAEKGTLGHLDFEHIFEVFIDENGFMRETPLEDENYIPLLGAQSVDTYEIMKENFHERILSYGKNTRFLKETRIFDIERSVAGTVDFVAIEENGKVSILDWKFSDFKTDFYDDIPWYKRGAWSLQMKQYKYIISKVHGVKNHEFKHTRMIPIKAHYSMGNSKLNILPRLLEIEIGDVNIKNINKDYLVPFGLEEEKTGNRKIDNLLEKLNMIYQSMTDMKVTPDKKSQKSEQLNSLYRAIRRLQIAQDVEPLIEQAKILNLQLEKTIQKYLNVFVETDSDGKYILNENAENTDIISYKIKDPSIFTEKFLSEYSDELESAINYSKAYTNLRSELATILDLETEEGKKLYQEIRETEEQARDLLDELQHVETSFVNNVIGKSVNILDIIKPEKVIKGISKWFSTTATLQMKSIAALYKKANKAFIHSAMDTRTEIHRLQEYKKEYTEWAFRNGYNKSNMFKILMHPKKDNRLLDQYNSEFYKKLKEKISEKDYKWIQENLNKEDYKEHLEKKLEEEILRIKSKPRVDTPENNDLAEKVEISNAMSRYDISTPTSLGWLLNDARNFPLKEKWESEQWKTLNKPENIPALKFYQYILERNKYFAEIGYISSFAARYFLPWVRKGLTEKLIFGGKTTLGEQFLRNITLDEKDTEFGQINALTGQPLDTVPILLTEEFTDADFSTDLFKTMGLYNEFAIKFNYLKEIEGQAKALYRLEKNKNVIATSYFGITKKDETGKHVDVKDEKQSNATLYEQMMKAIIYQQKYIESETFDTILGKIKDNFPKINKALGFKLLPENFEGKVFSINKSVTQLNNHYQLVVLGWNPLSSLSNLFGGKTQSFINSGKFFTKSEFFKTEMWLMSNRMNGSDKVKNLAALEYFLPFTDNYNRESINQLSLSKLSQESVQDYLMYLMRTSDRAVQTTSFFAFYRNTIIKDNKLHNVREYVRKNYPEFENMYAGSQQERNNRSEKFEKTVQELKNEFSLENIAKLDSKNKFYIPGIDRKDNSVVDLITKVQQFTNDSLGNATEANKRLINLTVAGNSAMIFKNWIPRLIDVRVGDMKYNAASDAYEWGRTRMISRFYYENIWRATGDLLNILKGTDKGINRARKLFEYKQKQYFENTGKKLEMNETEFINLVKQNIENQIFDTLIYLLLFAATAGLKAFAPDDEESDAVKNQWRFMIKATDKLTDELGYFYNPVNILDLFGRGIFPTINLIDNYRKVLFNFMKENYGLIMQNDKIVEDTKVIKYLMKTFPFLYQGAHYMGMFAPELAKELGITLQSTYNR